MLNRLKGEDTRIQQLVSAGELSPEGGALSTHLLTKNLEELLSELRKLEIEESRDGLEGASP
jgi:hypothetical protein